MIKIEVSTYGCGLKKSGVTGDLKDTGQPKMKHSSSSDPIITPIVKCVSGKTILVPGTALAT